MSIDNFKGFFENKDREVDLLADQGILTQEQATLLNLNVTTDYFLDLLAE